MPSTKHCIISADAAKAETVADRPSFLRKAAAKAGKAMLPKTWKGKALLYGFPLLLLLALLDPVFGIVHKVFDLLGQILAPALDTAIGRIVATLLSLAAMLWVLWRVFRQQVRSMRCHALLGRHFDATAALLAGDEARARNLLKAICRRRRVKPEEYPWIVQDACLKLARLALDAHRPAEALLWVARCSDPLLPPELDRSRCQLRIAALAAHVDALPETAIAEARQACDRHPEDARLWSALRLLLLAQGNLAGAAEAQSHVVEHAAPAELRAAQETLCHDARSAGMRALETGDLDFAKKMQRAIHKLPGPDGGLLAGEILVCKGDYRGAVRAFGDTASPEGLDRIAALLRERPGCVEPRELLACCPMQGTVLLVANELARLGQREAALRAARLAAEQLGPTPTVCLSLAETLAMLGETDRAQALAVAATQRLLWPQAPSDAPKST